MSSKITEQYGLKPDKFYEEYYKKLMERVNQVQQMIQQIWGSMSKEQKQEMIDKLKVVRESKVKVSGQRTVKVREVVKVRNKKKVKDRGSSSKISKIRMIPVKDYL